METLELTATAARMESGDEQSRLIRAAAAGDLAAFDLLMRRYERLVLTTALRLLGNMDDAMDASQDVFLRFYRNLKKLEQSENLTGWLYKVTVNACHDVRRRRPDSAPFEAAEAVPSSAAEPDECVAESERRRALQLSLRMLSERERTALVLRDLEGLSTGEVARVMGSSEATVRSQISQGRVKVREFLARYFRRRP